MVTHSVQLRGPDLFGDERPVILERTDRNFIAALLSELETQAGRDALPSFVANERVDGTLRLYQPVQRAFHLLLVDASCDTLGNPRIEASRIESAGMVLRRQRTGANNEEIIEAWQGGKSGPRGWIDISGREKVEPLVERRIARAAPHPLLARNNAAFLPLSEQVTPLFVAPPHICKAAGRTLLYGLIATTSSETSAAPTSVEYAADELAQMIPVWLQHTAARPVLPYAGERIGAAHAQVEGKLMANWMTFLSTLQIMFDAFEGTTSVHQAFRADLDRIPLSFPDGVTRSTSTFLQTSAELLVLNDSTVRSILMPTRWPTISATLSADFQHHVLSLVRLRSANILPTRNRFDEPQARYHIRAFARVRPSPDCPPDLVWSPRTEVFQIASWYDNGPTPPLQIQLPDLLPGGFKKLKPNVTFQVPASLFNFLQKNNPKRLMKGEAKKGSEGGLGWICGFNIPIITLVAFILLWVIIYLLNFVFFWLPWVRICIPFPSGKQS